MTGPTERARPRIRLRFRPGVLSRCLAASVGGYGTAAVVAMCLSLTLPMPRSEAVLLASLLSFPLYVVAIVWTFAARDAARAWIGLALAAGPPSIIVAAALLGQ